jgi:hypothetical protein
MSQRGKLGKQSMVEKGNLWMKSHEQIQGLTLIKTKTIYKLKILAF